MEQRIGWEVALASLSLAFALSLFTAWLYSATHSALSYLRGFTHSLAMGGIISALVMLAIGDEVARGLGVVGALTIVRFRTTLKDTRDLMFVFASLASGVACGVQSYAIALVGMAVFGFAVLFLSFTGFGSRKEYDAVLRVRMPAVGDHRPFAEALGRYCRSFTLVSLRDVGSAQHEHVYQVRLNDPSKRPALIQDLSAVPGVSGLTLLLQDTSVEP